MEEQIRDYIAPVCAEHGVHLLDIGIHGGGGNRIIRIVADTDEGITLNQCEMLSREFSDIFFRKDLFSGNYRLEVTSPGVQKPLEADYEFKRNIGRTLRVEYLDGDESKAVSGALKSYEQDRIELETSEGPVYISRKNIKNAHVKLKW
jgi:ribosome maturation factor RimP